MSDKFSGSGRTFEDNIQALFDELQLAVEWGRPSILLAVNKSKPGQTRAKTALEKKLTSLGQAVAHIEVGRENPNLAAAIAQTPGLERTVFFVTNLDWGEGDDDQNAYRALNIYREQFVESRVRVVFWLTAAEALNLPRQAPDFWAFRHRVIEFTRQSSSRLVDIPAGVLLWHIQDATDAPGRLLEKISLREQMIAELPPGGESLSSRIELHYDLGYLYWRLGKSKKTMRLLTEGVELGSRHIGLNTAGWLLNGLAVVQYESGESEEAIEIYNKALQGDAHDGVLLINLAVVHCAQGRNHEAISVGKRAVKAEPANARIHSSFGFMYLAMGRFDESLSSFKQAIELSSTHPAPYQYLAAAYRLAGRQEEALRQLEIAQEYFDGESDYPRICREAISGNSDGALGLLEQALRADRISLADVQRNPILGMLLDLSRLHTPE